MTTRQLDCNRKYRNRGLTRMLAAAALGGTILGGLAAVHPALADPAYVVTPIPGVTNILANGVTNTRLNKWGQVIASRNEGNAAPMLWSPSIANGTTTGVLLDLSTQVGYPASAYSTHKGDALALNDLGEVAGDAYVASGGDANNVLSWVFVPKTLNNSKGALHGTKGTVTTFAVMADGLAEYPSSINDDGQITGHGSYYHPELFTPTVADTATGTWMSDTNVGVTDFFINNAGMVGGGVYGSSLPNYHGWDFAFVQAGFPPVGGASIIAAPSWSLTSNADALGINQLGDVIVDTVPTAVNAVHGYLVKNGVVTDVGGNGGSDGAFLYGINDSDMIVGYDIDGPGSYPSLYANGTTYNLATLVPTANGLTLSSQSGPVAINDKGQILAGGGDLSGDSVFLLTPAAMIQGKQPKIASGSKHAIAGGEFTQLVTVTNTTGAILPGAVSVAFDGLPATVTVVGPTGTTAFAGPTGSPYIDFSAGNLAAGATASLTVTFAAPSAAAIVYTARALDGTAPR